MENCTCVNCECKECGLQNPDKLEGKSAKEAGVSDWTMPWYCDENCECCA